MHEWWVCHALSGVSPHSTRRVRNAMTSLGSVSVYLASVSFIYSRKSNQSQAHDTTPAMAFHAVLTLLGWLYTCLAATVFDTCAPLEITVHNLQKCL